MKFKSLGDAVAKFDQSGYATLGWSVVSFGLQVATNEQEARSLALSSSEFVTGFLTRYAQYEKWFRMSQPDEEFDRRLVKVYKAILLYVIALDKYLHLWKLGSSFNDQVLNYDNPDYFRALYTRNLFA
jgi:hypothetical protein